MVYAATTQIIYRYDSQYILSDSHGRIYNMRDWDSLHVPALAYDSLVWMKPEQSCHTNWTLNLLVGVMKKTLAYTGMIASTFCLTVTEEYTTWETGIVCMYRH